MNKHTAFGLIPAVVDILSGRSMGNPEPPPSPAPIPTPAPMPTPTPPTQVPVPTPVPTPMITPVPTIPAANLIFMVTDNATALPIKNAAITVDKVKAKTDDAGKAVFANTAPGDHKYTVSKRGYKRITGIVRVTGDTTVPVKLVSK